MPADAVLGLAVVVDEECEGTDEESFRGEESLRRGLMLLHAVLAVGSSLCC